MPDFLLELLSEEIPARMQERARSDLARLFADEIGKAGLKAQAIDTVSTPRRLALIARGLPLQTEAVRDELKGPRASAPPQALDGFLRKTGLTRDQLTERDGVLFAVVEKPGRATADVLAEAIPAIVRAFPWPKSMRWGEASISTESLRWVRPLQGVVALLGEAIVPFEIAGVKSGAATVGHRFRHPGAITIGSANDYAEKLRACHVIVDHEERRALIADGARAAAEAAGLTLVEDEGLLTENAGLTEWPVPLLGRFDPAFLDVPPEVIQLTMRTNQKYFACTDGAGRLAPAFVCVANIDATDGGSRVVEGNQKVLAARLSDAKFFWEQDLKVPLQEQAKKLDQIVFHEKLGTVADKVDRVAKLARWLVEEGIVQPSPPSGGEGRRASRGGERGESGDASTIPPSPGFGFASPPSPPEGGEGKETLAALAEQAARLCKADLVTGMVGEFPELQGVMGGYYARAQGLPAEVADAIRDHYKPVGQGDEVPTAPVTVAVSLADKLDTIAAGFFPIDEKPSGSRDPFALRRAALGIVRLVLQNELRLSITAAVHQAFDGLTVWKNDYRWLGWDSTPAGQVVPEFTRVRSGQLHLVENRSLSLMRNQNVSGQDEQVLENVRLLPLTQVKEDVRFFFADRLKVQQREAGVRHDLIDAVFALGGEDDLVRLLARVKALQAFVGTEDGANLLTGYRRAANILKKEGWTPADSASSDRHPGLDPGSTFSSGDAEEGRWMPGQARHDERLEKVGSQGLSYSPLPEEQSLIAALDSAQRDAAAAVQQEDFEGAMTALASLRGPIDAFFDKVTVNDADPAKRDARLALLARIRDAVHQVADFSKIEG